MKHRTNLYLSKIQVSKLKKVAKATDLSMSEHIRRAIDEYLAKFEERGAKR